MEELLIPFSVDMPVLHGVRNIRGLDQMLNLAVGSRNKQ